jgi:predicted NBD/HSP70 family sugar kinase
VDTLADLAALARAGNADALAVISSAGTLLGDAIAHLIGVLDVGEIVVHGSVTTLGQPWLDAIRSAARSRSLGPLVRETRVIDGGLGEDLTLLGAAAMLLTRELGLTVHR